MISTANTVWKMSKYGVISGSYFPVFGLNTGKYGPEKTPYLDSFTQWKYKGSSKLNWKSKVYLATSQRLSEPRSFHWNSTQNDYVS